MKMYLKFTEAKPGEKHGAETIRGFTEMLSLHREAWQVSQAQDAVRHYAYYLSRKDSKSQAQHPSEAVPQPHAGGKGATCGVILPSKPLPVAYIPASIGAGLRLWDGLNYRTCYRR